MSQGDAHQAQVNRGAAPQQRIKTGRLVLIILAAVLLLALIFNGFIKSNQPSTTVQLPTETQTLWDKRLLSCNKVFNAKPSDEFELCLQLAKDGNIDALKRVVWAYSRAGDYLDWRKVFDGLKVLSRTDRDAQLLLFALMKFISNDEKLKLQGETGIKRLANRNFAAANILLATLYALNENTIAQTSNIMWLLERAYSASPDVITPIDLAVIYANGLVSAKDIPKASLVLKEAANTYYPNGTNNVAWFLATLDDNPFAEPELALSYAKKVVEHPEYGLRHTYVDTLAATYAAAGYFDKAAQTQQQAIELIDSLGWPDARKEKEKLDFATRLALYEDQQSLTEYTLKVESSAFFIRLREGLVNRLINSLFMTIEEPPLPADLKENDTPSD
jgi:TPR repeat protein